MKFYGRVRILIILILYGVVWNGGCSSEPNRRTSDDKRIMVDASYILDKVKPGDKPITLSEKLLGQLLPELEEPRLMKYEDLSELDKIYFIREGFTFVLSGDFNGDGIADVAFVGRYNNPGDPDKNSFFAIVSIEQNRVIREFFYRIMHDRASLLRIFKYKNGLDGILVQYTMASDHCEAVYWTGKAYDTEPCQSVWDTEDNVEK